jgi:hypothetical protein
VSDDELVSAAAVVAEVLLELRWSPGLYMTDLGSERVPDAEEAFVR